MLSRLKKVIKLSRLHLYTASGLAIWAGISLLCMANLASAQDQSTQITNIQNYLAQQVCEAPTNTSADAAERALEACKQDLADSAEDIYNTCSGEPSDAEKIECIASEAAKVKADGGGASAPDSTDSDALHSDDGSNANKVFNILTVIVRIFSALCGVAIIASLVVAGIQYATAGGNAGAITKSKTRIVYTLMALVLYLMLLSVVVWLIPGSDILP